MMKQVRLLVLCALAVAGCDEITINYYDAPDAGSEAAMNQSVFESDSKLFGNENLSMDATPSTLIDLRTRGSQPHVISIEFGSAGASQIPFGPFVPQSELVALLTMGVGGTAYLAEVDVMQGQVLSVLASLLRVDVAFRRIPNGGALPVPAPTWFVGASVAEGVVSHGIRPQRTISTHETMLVGVPPIGIALHTIPPFATTLQIVAVPSASQLRVDIEGIGGLVSAQYLLVSYPSAVLPLPTGSRQVRLWNQGMANIVSHSLVFGLAL